MQKEFIYFVGILAATAITLMVFFGIKDSRDKRAFMENGYEQVLEPGISTPIWKKKL